MLRRLALSLLLALAPSLALAQFAVVGPTPPTADNGDRLATTAWVRNFLATGLPLASGKIFIGSAGNLATAQTPSGDCTLSVSGVITCTQAAGNFTVIGNLSVGGSIVDGNGVLMTNIVAPATPGAGTTRVYVDSTNKVLSSKNDAGTVSNTVAPSTAPSNQFATGLSSAGVIAYAQPSFANLSGSWTCAQAAALTGNVTTTAGSCATTIAALAVTNGMLAGSIAASKLVGTDIATVGTITAGTWNGTKVGLAYGGTNADLSATGGTSQFLKQASAGAAITVARPACADLSNAAASCSTDTTTQTNVAFTGLSAAAAAADADTFPTNQGAANLKQTLAAIKTWIKSWITKTDVGLSSVPNTDMTNLSNATSGTVAAARGGAGTITGALKGNGAGVVSQAACGDLSNGAASCSTDTTNASNISSGSLPNSRLATMATNTIKANATSGTAVPTDVAVSSCSGVQNFLQWVTNTGPQCGTAPSWTIDSGTVSASTTKTITVSGSPTTIMLFIEQLDVSASGTDILMRLNADSGANYQYGYTIVGTAGTVTGGGAGSATSCKIIPNVKAGFGARTTITLNAPLNAGVAKQSTFQSAATDNGTGVISSTPGACFWNSTAAITSVIILPSGGNTSFTYQMVGYK